MAQMGRPKIEINQEDFEKLSALLCTLDDISSWFKCSPDTIERWCKRTYEETFAEAHKKHAGKGRISLRRKQYEVAMKGNVTMLIWLGKQHLGQADKQETKQHVNVSSDEVNNIVDWFIKYDDEPTTQK
jgi:hypothetical protein